MKRVPSFLGVVLEADALLEIASSQSVDAENLTDFIPSPFLRLLASKSCRGAIMFGTPLTNEELDLAKRLVSLLV